MAYAAPAPSCTSLSDGGSSAASSFSGCYDIGSGEVHTITGTGNEIFYGDIHGANNDEGQIIIDGDVSNNGYLGRSGSSLNNLTINTGRTLRVNGSVNASRITLGGTLDVFYGGSNIIGAIDGLTEGSGVINAYSTIYTGGVIGGTNKISKINLSNGADLVAVDNISANQIAVNGSSDLYFYGGGLTIEADIITDYNYDGSVYVNQSGTLKGKIGTSTEGIYRLNINSGQTLTLAGDVFANPIYTYRTEFYGGTIAIDPSESAIADGASVTVLNSYNTLSYYGGAVTIADTAMVDYTATVNDNSIVVSASYNSAASLGVDGEGANIYQNAGNAIGSNTELFKALNNAGTSQQREDIIKSIKPDGSYTSTTGGMNLSNSTGGTISNHLALLRTEGSDTGIATGDQLEGMNIWTQVFGNDIEQESSSSASGYDADSYGLVIGADKAISDDMTLGFALTMAKSDITSKSAFSTDTDIDSYQLSAYLSKDYSNDYFMETILSYSMNDNTSSRKIAGGAVANASFDSKIIQAQLIGGKTIKSNGFILTPKVKLSFMSVDTDGYTETGAGGLNLTVNTDKLNQLEAYLGTTVAKQYDLESGASFIPEFKIGMSNRFGDDSVDINSTFQAGGNFNTTSIESDKLSLETGFGLAYVSADKLKELRFDYDLTKKTDYTKHTGLLTFKYKF